MRGPKSIIEYQMQISIAEIEARRDASVMIGNKPHIKNILESNAAEFFLSNLQNLFWTIIRIKSKISGRIGNENSEKNDAFVIDNPCMYIDITATYIGKSCGGIARVTTKIKEEAEKSGIAFAVYVKDGIVRLADTSERRIDFRSQDTYVVLDAFWCPFAEYQAAISLAHEAGAKVAVCIHDVIPATYPAFMVKAFSEHFKACLSWMIRSADLVISVSQASANEIQAYIYSEPCVDLPGPVRVVRLGSNAARNATGPIRRKFARIFDNKEVFISVGTLLPHKGQYLAVSAFNDLWTSGRTNAVYMLIGRKDKEFCATASIIKSSVYLNDRLFWIEDATDAELEYAYRHASCLVQPSIAEGFGIPVAEALAYGLPVLASDIPVFHEIGGCMCTYFRPADEEDLAEKLLTMASSPRLQPRCESWSWTDTFQDLLRAVGSSSSTTPATPLAAHDPLI